MTTKNKMIRTRLDDKTYKAFKELNDDLLIFEYTAVLYAVEYYLEKHGRMKEVPSQYRAVTGMIKNEDYNILDSFAEDNETSVSEVVSYCIRHALKTGIIPKEEGRENDR